MGAVLHILAFALCSWAMARFDLGCLCETATFHSSNSCEKTASRTPVSTQEKKNVRVCDQNARVRSQFVDVNVRWSGGYDRYHHVQGHGFEPRRGHLNFSPVPNTQSQRSGVQYLVIAKIFFNFFVFSYVHAWPETP